MRLCASACHWVLNVPVLIYGNVQYAIAQPKKQTSGNLAVEGRFKFSLTRHSTPLLAAVFICAKLRTCEVVLIVHLIVETSRKRFG